MTLKIYYISRSSWRICITKAELIMPLTKKLKLWSLLCCFFNWNLRKHNQHTVTICIQRWYNYLENIMQKTFQWTSKKTIQMFLVRFIFFLFVIFLITYIKFSRFSQRGNKDPINIYDEVFFGGRREKLPTFSKKALS